MLFSEMSHSKLNKAFCLLWFCLVCFESTQALVTLNRRNDFAGLHLKSIDIEERSSNDSEVYADLNYAPLKASSALTDVKEVWNGAINSSSITNSAVPQDGTSNITTGLNAATAPLNATERDPAADSVQNEDWSSSFDLFNYILGVISLIQIFMLTLLFLYTKWDLIIGFLICTSCKSNHDSGSEEPDHTDRDIAANRSRLALKNSIRMLSRGKSTLLPAGKANSCTSMNRGNQSMATLKGSNENRSKTTQKKKKNSKLTISSYLKQLMPRESVEELPLIEGLDEEEPISTTSSTSSSINLEDDSSLSNK